MKIGVLTYHNVANFGANLQTLSTVSNIRNNGYTPIVINWIPEGLDLYYKKYTSREQLAEHAVFTSTDLPLSRPCLSSKDIADLINEENIELVIIGSDAVFSYKPFWDRFYFSKRFGIRYVKPNDDRAFPNPFWGDFLKYTNVKIAVMSASAQNCKFTLIKSKGRKREFSQLISKFSYISVRDLWTQNMINYLTDSTLLPQITPDPVFAFNNNVGELLSKKYILNKYKLNSDYVLVSISEKFANKKWINELSNCFGNEGVNVVTLPKANKFTVIKSEDLNLSNPIPVIDWYYLIKYSRGYIGELMHPIIVSLHNNVPIFSIDTYGYKRFNKFNNDSSKIYQILNRFDLLNNWHNVIQHKTLPEPMMVYNAIDQFDSDKCSHVSSMLLKEYQFMMNKIYSQI